MQDYLDDHPFDLLCVNELDPEGTGENCFKCVFLPLQLGSRRPPPKSEGLEAYLIMWI
jgi:hypothetical protein